MTDGRTIWLVQPCPVSELSALVVFSQACFSELKTLGSLEKSLRKLFSDKNNHEELPPKKRRNVGKLWPFWFSVSRLLHLVLVLLAAAVALHPEHLELRTVWTVGRQHTCRHGQSRAVPIETHCGIQQSRILCVCVNSWGMIFSILCFRSEALRTCTYLYHTLYKRPALIIASHQHSTNSQSRLGYRRLPEIKIWFLRNKNLLWIVIYNYELTPTQLKQACSVETLSLWDAKYLHWYNLQYHKLFVWVYLASGNSKRRNLQTQALLWNSFLPDLAGCT